MPGRQSNACVRQMTVYREMRDEQLAYKGRNAGIAGLILIHMALTCSVGVA